MSTVTRDAALDPGPEPRVWTVDEQNFSSLHDLPPGTVAIRVGLSPLGEWTEWQKFGDGERRTRAFRQTHLIVADCELRHSTWLPIGKLTRGEIVSNDSEQYNVEYRGFPEGVKFCRRCGKIEEMEA